ncbi:MAG: DeoR family transcriptional regulator [bacterium]|nr:DeoR family transcriptional regulator [bacterium]
MENNNQDKETQNTANDNKSFVTPDFIHKKTERLVTAVYMLSNFFPEKEPLRWEVRKLGIDLLGASSSVFYTKTSDVENYLRESIGIIGELIVRFEIAHISSLISGMNFTVLKNELLSIRDTIESLSKSGKGQNILITSDFFAQDKLLEKAPEAIEAKEALPNKAISRSSSQQHPQSLSMKPMKLLSKAPEAIEAKEARSLLHSIASKRKGDRSETILKILKKKDNLTVKDIAQVISDCSEKTIQRELLALVDKNVLKKVGERRWSRYSLA